LPAFSIQVTSINHAPTIGGTPPTAAMSGKAYNFTPSSGDSDGNSLGFTIVNRPAWASFNVATGQLSGTPTLADVGSYAGIAISVSDGVAQASLAPFVIVVSSTATSIGTATLSWAAPTQNSDGSPLTNLTGYRIHYGTNASSMTQVVDLASLSLTNYTIGNLPAGTWFFAITAYNSAGVESPLSNVASKTI
jgi:hypothetical protein